jgi:hypothetical protein
MSLNTRLSGMFHTMRDLQLTFDARLPDAEREAVGTETDWSAKDVLVHCMVWAGRYLTDLETVERGEPWPEHDYGDFDDANRAIFEEHQRLSWDEAKAMIQEVHDRADAYLDRTSEETLLSTSEAADHPIWRRLAGNYIYHPMIHVWDYLHQHGHDSMLDDLFGEPFIDQLLAVHDDAEWQGTAHYNLACIYAVLGKTEPAIARLAEALRLNPGLTEWSKEDPDLDSLRDDPAFQALYA